MYYCLFVSHIHKEKNVKCSYDFNRKVNRMQQKYKFDCLFGYLTMNDSNTILQLFIPLIKFYHAASNHIQPDIILH